MAQVSTEIIYILKKYIQQLGKNNFPIKTAILYGSYAQGSQNDFSDIDIALVSDAFEGNPFLDKEKIRKIKLDIDYRISPLPFKTEDFTEEDLFIKEILETGIRIV